MRNCVYLWGILSVVCACVASGYTRAISSDSCLNANHIGLTYRRRIANMVTANACKKTLLLMNELRSSPYISRRKTDVTAAESPALGWSTLRHHFSAVPSERGSLVHPAMIYVSLTSPWLDTPSCDVGSACSIMRCFKTLQSYRHSIEPVLVS